MKNHDKTHSEIFETRSKNNIDNNIVPSFILINTKNRFNSYLHYCQNKIS